ncbi:hypothetical protein SAMN06297387_103367 [Streptomyces zhaozhouensis]|uniref:Uncharacterized protein n=1 Tax=Streptomyces zhaozhouensis TaxID=1300267 RepID=A0A286DSX4_9ACTN|nr:hypothetical protein SAMN06297387_103367 [Streptomyces zhaozhouensis]
MPQLDADWYVVPPAPGTDSTKWVVGPCWFYCDHRITAVLWIGTVTTEIAYAPIYAGAPCLVQLDDLTWDYHETAATPPPNEHGRALPLYRAWNNPAPPQKRRQASRPPTRTRLGARLRGLLAINDGE